MTTLLNLILFLVGTFFIIIIGFSIFPMLLKTKYEKYKKYILPGVCVAETIFAFIYLLQLFRK
jgi:hypothetical protein